ncbi:hypothetical protein BDN71DRAFT_1509893 [Pleurotus eryngii]|uniref:Uncharacterized protein n=1 Tax=Pleurotus eryngii TaxID=5323 RepID=A0A9P5ZQX3_PLEER|nr:hypothetical protein BDN71DRAFT_1509893 [Pleurotus eryngii]
MKGFSVALLACVVAAVCASPVDAAAIQVKRNASVDGANGNWCGRPSVCKREVKEGCQLLSFSVTNITAFAPRVTLSMDYPLPSQCIFSQA